MADTQRGAEGFRGRGEESGLSMLEDVMPGGNRRPMPDQPEREPEPGGAHPAIRIRLDGNVLTVLQRVDLEPYFALARVSEPELGDTRPSVQQREALRVLALRTVADDLH